ncbi:TerB family tellurite resistance protein [Candidatus Thalassolituus haligoni]|uniref:tellurite resistance TerB family protein n=1 Tax=Candidatus Thalassolituus haligoni TaxID=3100113 RepID=UPI003518AFAB|tara:strand:- start:27624 stop:28082 length:459 start_codon:yes stop_codon:yes gene_type:complete
MSKKAQMLKKLLKLFTEDNQPAADKHTLDLSAAALLVEVMRADHTIDADEQHELSQVLNELFQLTANEISELLQQAEHASEQASDLFQFTDVVHKHFSTEQKFDLLTGLWRIAYASAGIDKYEEHIIRRIAELLYMPHSEFIRAKLTARPEL